MKQKKLTMDQLVELLAEAYVEQLKDNTAENNEDDKHAGGLGEGTASDMYQALCDDNMQWDSITDSLKESVERRLAELDK